MLPQADPDRTPPPAKDDDLLARFQRILQPGTALSEQVEFLGQLQDVSGDELAGMAGCLRSRCVRIKGVPADAVDLCGTGGDRSGTFNISTVAAFVVAGAGIPVAKHGNYAVSSKCGSSDCLAQLGVQTQVGPHEAGRLIREVGIAFLHAPRFHPATAAVAEARRVLAARGRKTVFNILGPLVNPAFVRRQAVGVFRDALIEPVARALLLSGARQALVYHGDGLDEITLTGTTRYARLRDGHIRVGVVDPRELGFELCVLADIAGGSAAENATIAHSVLAGKIMGPRRDIVVLNAAAGISVGSDMQLAWADCIVQARESIDSGRALEKLERLRNEAS